MEKVMSQGRDIEEILFEAHIYEKAFQQILKQKQKYNYEEN